MTMRAAFATGLAGLAFMGSVACRSSNEAKHRQAAARNPDAPVDGYVARLAMQLPPDPYGFFALPSTFAFAERRRARVLATLRPYRERRCELIAMPSEGFIVDSPTGTVESSVFIARGDDGTFEVVSTGNPYGGSPRTKTAPIDAATVDVLSKVCSAILVHRSEPCCGGIDGTTFYAAHWTSNGDLSGEVDGPRDGTVAMQYLRMETVLHQFAAAAPDAREELRRDLVARAKALSSWIEMPSLPGAEGCFARLCPNK